VLPHDKEKMLQPVNDFLGLAPEEQMVFCIGRRTHRFSRFSDLNNPLQRDHALKICSELNATAANYDAITDSIMQRFI
jgi:hypothetical protein